MDRDIPSPIVEQQAPAVDSRVLNCPGVRQGVCLLGVICVALGVAGLVLPVLPSTIFFLIALVAFSRSSDRFQAWLYQHPRLDRPLRRWHRERVFRL